MSAPGLGPSPTQIARMRARIAEGVARRTRERRRRARLTMAVSAAALAALVTAGSIVVATWPREVTAGGYLCFVADDPAATSHSIGYPTDLEPPETAPERVAAALEMCAIAYGAEGITAPHPTVCELPDLRLAVFPNLRSVDDAEFCASLGLGIPD